MCYQLTDCVCVISWNLTDRACVISWFLMTCPSNCACFINCLTGPYCDMSIQLRVCHQLIARTVLWHACVSIDCSAKLIFSLLGTVHNCNRNCDGTCSSCDFQVQGDNIAREINCFSQYFFVNIAESTNEMWMNSLY